MTIGLTLHDTGHACSTVKIIHPGGTGRNLRFIVFALADFHLEDALRSWIPDRVHVRADRVGRSWFGSQHQNNVVVPNHSRLGDVQLLAPKRHLLYTKRDKRNDSDQGRGATMSRVGAKVSDFHTHRFG